MSRMTESDKQTILNQLRNNQTGVTVVFTKLDGSERKMVCTLVEGKIPTDKKPYTQTTPATTSEQAVRVFDLEIEEWRSFRWDSVKRVTYSN